MVVSSGGGIGQLISLKAADSMAAKQYYPVKLTADHTVGTCSLPEDRVIGINQGDAAQNAQTDVLLLGCGVSKIVMGGTIAVASDVFCGTDGRGHAAQTADAINSVVIGRTLEAATTTEALGGGDIISIVLTPPNIGTTS